MNKKDFYYNLPEELIAQVPLARRDGSRLMYLPVDGDTYRHEHFPYIKNVLKEGDCLVLNDSRVIPARLIGAKEGLEHPVEFLLLKRHNVSDWETLVRPGRRLRPGAHVVFIPGILEADVLEVFDGGNRLVRFQFQGVWEEVLSQAGQVPLPPYIHEKLEDPERYQTVYSVHEGSAAAPTAGLHFTQELLDELEKQGVRLVYVTLHVGLGTFRPVKEDDILEHDMHSEFFILSQTACDTLNEARLRGNKIVSCGTTSCRVLESAPLKDRLIQPFQGETDIFIYPGYKFKVVDDLITNFHLPESTLIMLVSALAGRERILAAYEEAVRERYRFFSFGDAMYIKGNPKNYKGLHQGKVY